MFLSASVGLRADGACPRCLPRYKSIPSLTALRCRTKYVKQMETVQQSNVLGQGETDVTSGIPSTVMRLSATIARYLLGFLMTMGGLNGFLHFAHHPLPTLILARQYMEALLNSHYMMAVAFLQGTAGILLLVNRFVPLALTVLAAFIFNILLYHATLEAEGSGAAIVVSLLWIVVFLRHRTSFKKLFRAR